MTKLITWTMRNQLAPFNNIPFSLVTIAYSVISVIPVAFVISMAHSRIPALKSYLSSLILLHEVEWWALAGFMLFPGMILLPIVTSNLLGRQIISKLHYLVSDLTPIGLVVFNFLYQLLFFNATGEEVGWRGFALPRLQAKTSPLNAALIIS